MAGAAAEQLQRSSLAYARKTSAANFFLDNVQSNNTVSSLNYSINAYRTQEHRKHVVLHGVLLDLLQSAGRGA